MSTGDGPACKPFINRQRSGKVTDWVREGDEVASHTREGWLALAPPEARDTPIPVNKITRH